MATLPSFYSSHTGGAYSVLLGDCSAILSAVLSTYSTSIRVLLLLATVVLNEGVVVSD